MEPAFDFGEALKRMKLGKGVKRKGWGPNAQLAIHPPGPYIATRLPYFELVTPGGMVVPWSLSHGDLLATDWYEEVP